MSIRRYSKRGISSFSSQLTSFCEGEEVEAKNEDEAKEEDDDFFGFDPTDATALGENDERHGTADHVDGFARDSDGWRWKLTAEELSDLASWRTRLEVDRVFSADYSLPRWARREMDAIADVLGLKDPGRHPGYLVSVLICAVDIDNDVSLTWHLLSFLSQKRRTSTGRRRPGTL